MRSTWRFCRTHGELSSRSRGTCSDHPNVESHTVRLFGDTDHWKKLETGAKSAEQQWVRGVETVGCRERGENRVLQPGMSDNLAKFEETWKSWEHQVDVYEKLSSSKLDDDVKISVVLCEAPQKLRDQLLLCCQQFESNYNKLRAIIQTYLNTNKTWIVNDFTDPMEVDYKGKGKSKSISKGKGSGKPDDDKEVLRVRKKRHFARDSWSRANHDKMVNEVEVENVNAEPGKEFVFTVKNDINDVKLSQDGCAEREDGLVMIDSGASVNVCPKWFGNSKLEQSDGATCLRGANGKSLQEYGKRQIWLRICGQTKRFDFHVVNVTKPILSVSWLGERGVQTHLAKKSFLRLSHGHEPPTRQGGVYFVKAQTVIAVEDMTRETSQEPCVRSDGSEDSCVRADGRSEKSCVQADGSEKFMRTS